MTLLLLLRTPAYEQVLLEMARSAIARGNDGDYEVAVVTAQMAAEISSEQSIGTYLARKNVPELEEPLAGLFPSYQPCERPRAEALQRPKRRPTSGSTVLAGIQGARG